MKVEFVRDIEPILERGGPLDDKTKDLLRLWLAQGAKWPAEVKFPSAKSPASAAASPGDKIDFVRDIVPVLVHGGPLSDKAKETLQPWVDQGASWPSDCHLGHATGGAQSREMELAEQIHEKILDTSKEKMEADMKAYTNTIPGSTVAYAMVPIPRANSSWAAPPARRIAMPTKDRSTRVKIDPFWMEQCEVTWNEYELFMYPDETASVPPTNGTTNYTSAVADAVTRPTKPYVEMSFGMGKDGYPAISMTQHAAQHLLPMAQRQDRPFLPAADGGGVGIRLPRRHDRRLTSSGDDPAQLGEYAWYADNSDMKYQKVGKKKPNPWGLYDILGNVDRMDPGPIRRQLLQTIHRTV